MIASMHGRSAAGLVFFGVFALGPCAVHLAAETVTVAPIKVLIDHNSADHANPGFYFADAPRPSTNDAATAAAFSILEGEEARNSGGLAALHDGRLPSGPDRPDQNFFFKDGTDGGMLRVDLGKVISIQAVDTYSCHPSERAPQIYTLYASDGQGTNMIRSPRRGDDLEKCGWKRIATVATGRHGSVGGQWAVSISGVDGTLGRFRYLVFDIHSPGLNTFYSEIDVIPQNSPASSSLKPDTIHSWNAGAYRVVIDTSDAPELTEWAGSVLGPVGKEWYSNIARMLPSAGFEAPPECSIKFRSMGPVSDAGGQIVAFTRGARITCGSEWFRQNSAGEAVGCVVHEMVHVVQQYLEQPGASPQEGQPPSWLVEGIADYVRWFLFEPQSHGAEITRTNLSIARYDASYRITANFLNWVVKNYGRDVIVRLNAAARKNEYHPALWEKLTGHTVQDLGREWRMTVEKELNAAPATFLGGRAFVADQRLVHRPRHTLVQQNPHALSSADSQSSKRRPAISRVTDGKQSSNSSSV
jgi:hypothetical protein